MYRYESCPKCGKAALIGLKPVHPARDAFTGACLHCGEEFLWKPHPAETERNEPEKAN
jgi:hypothetical protein